jgi:hypothetical protein
MLVAASGLSDELDTEGGSVRVRLIVGLLLCWGRFVCGGCVEGFTRYGIVALPLTKQSQAHWAGMMQVLKSWH